MTVVKQGALRGEHSKYSDGERWMCLWYPLTDEPDDEDMGVCFDFKGEDAVDLLHLVNRLIDTEPTIVKDEPKQPEQPRGWRRYRPLRWLGYFVNAIGWRLVQV